MMGKKVVAIVGTYRRGRAGDSAVDEILRGAKSRGAETDSADALVLASRVNVGTVTAVMKRFSERLVACAYWPRQSRDSHEWRTAGGLFECRTVKAD